MPMQLLEFKIQKGPRRHVGAALRHGHNRTEV